MEDVADTALSPRCITHVSVSDVINVIMWSPQTDRVSIHIINKQNALVVTINEVVVRRAHFVIELVTVLMR